MPCPNSTKQQKRRSDPSIIINHFIIVNKVPCLTILILGIIAVLPSLWNIAAPLYRMHRSIHHSPHSLPKNRKSMILGLFVALLILRNTPGTIHRVILLMDGIMILHRNLKFMHLQVLTVIVTIRSCPHFFQIFHRTQVLVCHHQIAHYMLSMLLV